MYPQQVLDSCYSAKDSSFYIIPADIAHFLGSTQLAVTMFSFVYFELPRNYVLTKFKDFGKGLPQSFWPMQRIRNSDTSTI